MDNNSEKQAFALAMATVTYLQSFKTNETIEEKMEKYLPRDWERLEIAYRLLILNEAMMKDCTIKETTYYLSTIPHYESNYGKTMQEIIDNKLSR